MLKWFLLFLLALPLFCFSQYTISGKILSTADEKPVANASVFLNNSVAGSKTADNGDFKITNVRPGQYDLVVSIIGFQTFHQNILVSNDTTLARIKISPKTIVLNEVKIQPHDNWKRDYDIFKRLFLGTSENATQCKILNPDLLDLDNNLQTGVFKASSYDFLEIENRALGYKIRYLLSDFTNDSKAGVLYYEGSASFEELKGSARQKRRWAKNRLKAYYGSSMHFLRSVISNSVNEEGFRVMRLIRTPNPDYNGFGAKFKQSLVNIALASNEFVKPTDIRGLFAMSFKDCLDIEYDDGNVDGPRTSIVTFDGPYAFFDFNGIIANPRSVIIEGDWTKSLMAELLPVDYEVGVGD